MYARIWSRWRSLYQNGRSCKTRFHLSNVRMRIFSLQTKWVDLSQEVWKYWRTIEKTFWLQPSVVYIKPFTPRIWRTTTQAHAILEVPATATIIEFFLHWLQWSGSSNCPSSSFTWQMCGIRPKARSLRRTAPPDSRQTEVSRLCPTKRWWILSLEETTMICSLTKLPLSREKTLEISSTCTTMKFRWPASRDAAEPCRGKRPWRPHVLHFDARRHRSHTRFVLPSSWRTMADTLKPSISTAALHVGNVEPRSASVQVGIRGCVWVSSSRRKARRATDKSSRQLDPSSNLSRCFHKPMADSKLHQRPWERSPTVQGSLPTCTDARTPRGKSVMATGAPLPRQKGQPWCGVGCCWLLLVVVGWCGCCCVLLVVVVGCCCVVACSWVWLSVCLVVCSVCLVLRGERHPPERSKKESCVELDCFQQLENVCFLFLREDWGRRRWRGRTRPHERGWWYFTAFSLWVVVLSLLLFRVVVFSLTPPLGSVAFLLLLRVTVHSPPPRPILGWCCLHPSLFGWRSFPFWKGNVMTLIKILFRLDDVI